MLPATEKPPEFLRCYCNGSENAAIYIYIYIDINIDITVVISSDLWTM